SLREVAPRDPHQHDYLDRPMTISSVPDSRNRTATSRAHAYNAANQRRRVTHNERNHERIADTLSECGRGCLSRKLASGCFVQHGSVWSPESEHEHDLLYWNTAI